MIMADILEKEFEYFTENHSELYNLYPNRYLVIKDQKVLFDVSQKNGLVPGTYIIQKCEEGVDSYTQVYHSRVTFA
jgi:hypothetical protein